LGQATRGGPHVVDSPGLEAAAETGVELGELAGHRVGWHEDDAALDRLFQPPTSTLPPAGLDGAGPEFAHSGKDRTKSRPAMNGAKSACRPAFVFESREDVRVDAERPGRDVGGVQSPSAAR
jgi:hypothetical protein